MSQLRPVTDGGSRPRLDSLTGLRALAAAIVFFHHATSRLPSLFGQGAIGVTFFFALSGFVLIWSRTADDTARSFWRRRFARIYPAYIVALMGGFVVTSHYGGIADLRHLLPAVFTVQSWIPNQNYYFAIDGPLWSVSCEMFFYLTFPLYAQRLIELGLRSRRLLQAALLAALAAVTCAVWFSHPTAVSAWLVGQAPIVRMLEFVLGALVAVDVMKGQWPRIPWQPAFALAAGAYLLAGRIPAAFGNALLPIVPILLVLGTMATADRAGRRTPFARRPVVWLGEVSYCFYLVHVPVIAVVRHQRLGSLGEPATVAACLLASLVAAWVLHVVVERPLERRLRKPRRPVPVAPAVPDAEPAPAA
jgi:peptidoglycan/LPS O-acetylase OafA/YrhL